MADIGAMFRDKTKSADDILRALSTEALIDGYNRATEKITGIYDMADALDDTREYLGHPNLEMNPSPDGVAWMSAITEAEVAPYRLALGITTEELIRRGVFKP